MHRTSHQYMAIHMQPLHRNVSVCMRVRMRVWYSRVLQLYQSPRGSLQTRVSTDGLPPSPSLDGSTRSANAPVRFPYSWTTVPPRTNLTLVPFNVLTSGKPGWCTWNTSRFARPWRKLTPFLTILHVMEVKTPSVHIVLSYLHAKLSTCVNRYSMLVPMVHLNTI